MLEATISMIIIVLIIIFYALNQIMKAVKSLQEEMLADKEAQLQVLIKEMEKRNLIN